MSGKLYGSGQNYSGQLGDGTVTSSTSLIQVGADVDWDLAVDVELEIVKILITKGQVGEANEITRRLANLKEVIEDEDE